MRVEEEEEDEADLSDGFEGGEGRHVACGVDAGRSGRGQWGRTAYTRQVRGEQSQLGEKPEWAGEPESRRDWP